MKTLLISLAALTLISCDVTKRHQRLIRKHPQLLELISTPKQDTVRIDNTKQIECPDGTVVTVNCDTLIIYETNNVTLPLTNAQIRQQERTKRNFEDNVRRMYQDSLKHAERIYRLENQRLKNELRENRKMNKQNQKTERTNIRKAAKNIRAESRAKWFTPFIVGLLVGIIVFLAFLFWFGLKKD